MGSIDRPPRDIGDLEDNFRPIRPETQEDSRGGTAHPYTHKKVPRHPGRILRGWPQVDFTDPKHRRGLPGNN